MEQGDFLVLVAEILEVDKVDITDALGDRGWDSLSSLSFIAEVDERVGIEINADELAGAKTVRDLMRLVSS